MTATTTSPVTRTTSAIAAIAKPGKLINVGLWAAQGLLFLAFGLAGFMKTTAPLADLAMKMPWTADVPAALVRFIGTAELLGALGMILPSVMRIKPQLTALAGLGLTTIMVLASVFHVVRGEYGVPAFNLTLGALAAFVAWGRFKKMPIAPR